MTIRGAALPPTATASSVAADATFWQDLASGARLTVNGGRASWLRLILTTTGIGLCVAVLMLAGSLQPALDSRAERAEALTPQYLSPSWLPLQDSQDQVSLATPGSFEAHDSAVPYRGLTVNGWDLATLPQHLDAAPLPPGVDRFPAPGELVVSPALADLLATPGGADLRTRLTGQVIGTIAPATLLGPDELRFYRGAEPSATEATRSTVATGWGLQVQGPPDTSDRYLPALLLAGTTVVIVPLLIFVSLVSRLGGPARDRRSAAIRLIGASAAQLRRITLVETGLAAVCGLLLGGLGYLLARQAAPLLQIGAAGFFPSDLTPAPAALLAIVVFVPAVDIGAAVAGGRRITAEPLGVLRSSSGTGSSSTAPTAAELTTVVGEVAAADGVRTVVGGVPLGGTVGATAPTVPGQQIDSTGYFSAEVTPCAAIPEVPDCRDGQIFALAPGAGFDEATARQAAITMDRLAGGAAVVMAGFGDPVAITLPPPTGPVQRDPARFVGHGDAALLITPGALGEHADALMSGISLDLRVIADNPTATVADQLRTSMGELTWRARVATTAEITGSRAEFISTARTGLVIGAVLTLLVAVLGLLVMTIEQVVDRRRALTLTVATGVPRGVIARSLMIGTAIPILVGVLLAALVGTGLSAFLLTLIDETWRPDWALLGLFAAGAVLTVAVTALSVSPLVARLTRLDEIRTG